MEILAGRALLNINYSSSTSYPVAGVMPNGLNIPIYLGAGKLALATGVALGTAALLL